MVKITQPENSPIEFGLFNQLRFALEVATHTLDLEAAGQPVAKKRGIPHDLKQELASFKLNLHHKIEEVQLALARGEAIPAGLVSALVSYEKAEQERIKDEILLPKEVAKAAAAGAPKKRGVRKTSAFKLAAGKFPGTSESDAERKYLSSRRKVKQREGQ